MIDKFVELIPKPLLTHSGSVFCSGRTAFEAPSKLYILGSNPGGSPQEQAGETIGRHTQKVLNGSPDWSAYRDERWKGKPPGIHGMQPRVLHLLRQLNLEPGQIPASNVVFVRSAREADISAHFHQLAQDCWPFHKSVIEHLDVRVVLCFGKKSGEWVCKQLNARKHIDQFVENNNRHWKSRSFIAPNGVKVVVATHPSTADWTTPATDPSPMVKRILAGAK